MRWFNNVLDALRSDRKSVKKTRNKTRRVSHVRPSLESLETRELMAADGPMIDDFLPRGAVNGLYDNHLLLSGDFDNNGLSDVLYINKQSGHNRAVLNEGNGQFTNRDDSIPRGLINGLYDNHLVLAGDFDSNGFADVMYIHKQTGQNRLVLNQGNGLFSNRDDFLPRGLVNGLGDNYVVVAGDFDKSGFADVLYVHKQSGQNRLVLNQGNGQFDNRDDFVPPGFINGLYDNHVVLAGDFDRNGFADLLYIHKESGRNRFVFHAGNGQFTNRDDVLPRGSVNQLYDKHFAVAGDFDRDSDADLIYINKETGANRLLGSKSNDASFLPAAYQVAAVADMDGNGSVDYVIQRDRDGSLEEGKGKIIFMQGNRKLRTTDISQPGDPWKDIRIAGAADFNGDKKIDLVFELRSSGDKGIWQMNGAQRTEQTWINRPSDSPKLYSIGGVEDFNGDGRPDLALNYSESGDKTIWVMNGIQRAEAYWVPRPSDSPRNYQVVAAGDFNRDGKADLVLDFLPTGRKAVWLMKSPTVRDTAIWVTGPSDDLNRFVSIVGAADVNIDGKTDLVVFEKNAIDLVGWYMDGTTRVEAIWVGRRAVDAAWTGGVLAITSTALADNITINPTSGGVMLVANGTYDYFTGGTINQIVVDALGGDDTVQNLTGLPSIIRGGDGQDTLVGGSAADWVYGGEGDDVLYGNGGSDVLFGNAGNDQLYGGLGSDSTIQEDVVSYDAGSGTVIVTGTNNDDDLQVGDIDYNLIVRVSGHEVAFLAANGLNLKRLEMHGLNGSDSLRNETSLPSTIYGDAGYDTLYGGTAADWLYGGGEDDVLYGNGGSDVLFGNAGNDQLYGGLGSDSTIQEDYVSYDSATGTVLIQGTNGDDTLQVGDLGLNLVVRVAGNEVAFLAHDGLKPKRLEMHGLAGNDIIRNDTYLPSTLYGDADRDTLYGGSAADWLYGGGEDDVLYGNNGNDVMFGGAGSDSLAGGSGSDSEIHDDNVSFDPSSGIVTIQQIAGDQAVQVGDMGSNVAIHLGGNQTAFLAAGGVQVSGVVLRFESGNEVSLTRSGVLSASCLGTLGDGVGGIVAIEIDADHRIWFLDHAGRLNRSQLAWGEGGFDLVAPNVFAFDAKNSEPGVWIVSTSGALFRSADGIPGSFTEDVETIYRIDSSAHLYLAQPGFEAQLAQRWAPILYQDVDQTGGIEIFGITIKSDSSLGGKSDYITAVDFDGNWDTQDNWNNIARERAQATMYYSVVTTTTHWYITYAFYYPRDWHGELSVEEHENDMEGCLAIVKRPTSAAPQDFGVLEGLVTEAHTDFYSYNPQGDGNAVTSARYRQLQEGLEDIDGRLYLEAYRGENHPTIEAESNGHGVVALRTEPGQYEFDGGDGIRYVPTLNAEEEPENPNDREVRYKLVDIFAEGGLWSHFTEGGIKEHHESKTFASNGHFRGDEGGGGQNKAQPPWLWDDTGDIVIEGSGRIFGWDDQLPKGTIAYDPARLADIYFDGEEFSRKYVSNPYQEITKEDNVFKLYGTPGMDKDVFLVHGLSNTTWDSSHPIYQFAANLRADVHTVNWNNLESGGNFLFSSDERFTVEMAGVLSTYDPDDTLIVVGYSYGGDSALKAVNRTTAQIDLLALLDPIAGNGTRTSLPQVVPGNVRYLYNRWQTDLLSSFPIDRWNSGELTNFAFQRLSADMGIMDQAEAMIAWEPHLNFPYDPTIHAEIKSIFGRLLA